MNTLQTPVEGTDTDRRQEEPTLPKGFSRAKLGQINWLTLATQ